jgi:hypothetical protein
MRRLAIAVIVLIVVALSFRGSAQVPGYPSGCAKCFVTGYNDFISDGAVAQPTTTLSRSNPNGYYTAGWGFQCDSGQPADRIDVFYRGDDGYFVPVSSALWANLPRWDVVAAYAQYCPSVSSQSGYQAYFNVAAIPAGERDLIINIWKAPYFAQAQTHVTIVP